MDDAGRPVRDEKLLRDRVEGETAEPRHALRCRVDLREQDHLSARAVDAPHRSRAAAVFRRTELARNELGADDARTDALDRFGAVGQVDRQPVGRSRREIEIGLRCIVECDAKDLAGLRRRHDKSLQRVGKLALGTDRAQIHNRCSHPLGVDGHVVERILAVGRIVGDEAGKTADDRAAGADDPAVLRRGRRSPCRHGKRQSQCGTTESAPHPCGPGRLAAVLGRVCDLHRVSSRSIAPHSSRLIRGRITAPRQHTMKIPFGAAVASRPRRYAIGKLNSA